MKFFTSPLLYLTLIYLAISIFVFQEFGIKIVNDSPRYLEYAENLKEGFYFDRHNFWYIGYPLFIILIRSIHDSIAAIIVAQYALSLLAVIAIYKTYLLLFDEYKGAVISALLYMFFVEIMIWNSYILCESLYCSFTCFSLYLLALMHKIPGNKFWFLAFLIVPWTILIKPTGIALAGGLLIVLIYKLWHFIKQRWIKASLAIVLFIVFGLLINKMLTTFLIMENYQMGEIIYAVSYLPQRPELKALIMTPPDGLYIPSEGYPPVVRITMFIVHHPIYWIKLFGAKLFYFVFHFRPFWSPIHNLYNLILLLPVYYHLILSFIKRRYSREVKLFAASYLTIHLLSVGMTSVDWDGRFLMPLLPVVFLLGARGMSVNLQKILVIMRRKSPALSKDK